MKKDDIAIESVSDYVSKVGKFDLRYIAQWFYRGHANSEYKLQPSLFRLPLKYSKEDAERYLMTNFKAEATPHLIHTPSDENEWLAIAQHFGLPTRLLDWTTNALIALYFAVESQHDRDGDVWCAGIDSTTDCLPTSTYLSKRTELLHQKVIYFPRHISPRIGERQEVAYPIEVSETSSA